MRRTSPARALAASLILALFFLITPTAVAAEFRAGARTVDITPPPGLPMWGYGARKDLPATGTHDPLLASVVVLQVHEEKLAIVGLDLGRSPARATLARIRKRIKEGAGIDHMYLVGSHTHHGPCLELETIAPTSKYIDTLVEKLSDAIIAAADGAQDAKMGIAKKTVDWNRNRHTNIEPKPVDRDLIVMRIDAMDGKPIATVVNFAAHPTTRDSKMLKYSSDFPGPMRTHVEKEIGGVCVYLQGAAGDLSTDRKGLSTDEYGVALGKQVLELRNSISPTVPSQPSLQTREEELTFKPRTDLQDPQVYLLYSLGFFKDLVDQFREEYKDGIRPSLTISLLNGEIGIVGCSGEFFCTHALRLKERARLPYILFLGYCNGYHQYFPTIEAAAEGGYGADPLVSPVEIGAGEKMMDRALMLLYDMRTKNLHYERKQDPVE